MAEGGRRNSSDDELPWNTNFAGKWRKLDEDPDSDETGSTSTGEDFEWEEMMVKASEDNLPGDGSKTPSVSRRTPPKKPPRVEPVDTLRPDEKPTPIRFKGLVKYPQNGNYDTPRSHRLIKCPQSEIYDTPRPQGLVQYNQPEIYDSPKRPMLAARDFFGNTVERLPSDSESDDDSNTAPSDGGRGWIPTAGTAPQMNRESPELLRNCQFVNRYNQDQARSSDARPKTKTRGGFVKSKNWFQYRLKPTKLASMKDLSGSIKSLMNIKIDTDKPLVPQANPRDVMGAVCGSSLCPSFRNTFFLYLEGSMGIGKTSLIKHLREVSGDNVISFTEPMVYWREVYDDCVKSIYKCCRPSNVGKKTTSSKILSTQMKFMTPLKCLQTSTRRFLKTGEPLQHKVPGDNWVIFDRHIMSPTLVFPLVFLKNGYLSFEHFMSIVSNFRAHEGDIIGLLCMADEDNLKMIKKRNRKGEEGVSSSYLKDVSQAFHSCYCTWLLLRYFSPEDMVSVCCCDVTLSELCIMKSMSNEKHETALSLFTKSIFGVISDVIQPFKSNCTIIEICLTLFLELKKLEFIVVNASEYIGDIPGVWTSVYMQAFKNRAIKTQTTDWTGLKAFARSYNS
ncbi:thymidine kinase [Rhinolophus gammaherpesvirus 1]|uniref:Thymidine kinase n=1 Tax=Rhinolophus gammaherpesvirus 1 TaxID=2054179 RepID=A0A2Z5U7A6_9GAMA|nr:thymidine kinase [Rhinolophus gammaherpesvirus 1]BBB06470.1 thymidine kinase [Rhinolophus gammaherpesvirus 1]